MKILITESQLSSAYWKYLKYLLGDLTEVTSWKYPDSRFWKNDKYGTVLELLSDGSLRVRHNIWEDFSDFFNLDYYDVENIMKLVFEEHLDVGIITPVRTTSNTPFGWNHL